MAAALAPAPILRVPPGEAAIAAARAAPAELGLAVSGDAARCPTVELAHWSRKHRPCAPSANRPSQPRRARCQAARKTSRPPAQDIGAGGDEQPPRDRGEALAQARTALTAILGKSLRRQEPRTVRQRQRQERQLRLRIELPLEDDQAAQVISLYQDLVEGLFRNSKGAGRMVVLFGDSQAAQLAAKSTSAAWQEEQLVLQVAALSDTFDLPDETAVVILMAPTDLHLPAVENLCIRAGSSAIVAINAQWDDDGSQVAGSFEVCYAFLPLAIQGLFGKSEGAVLKFVRGGAPGGTPWLIFTKDGDKFKCVNRLNTRPDAVAIESTLYNNAAASSPINRSLAFFRGLAGKSL